VLKRNDWGSIGRISVAISLVTAIVLFFALPDQRWISAVVVGLAVLDAIIYGLVLPRLTSTGDAPSLSDLERMHGEAGEAAATDDDWDFEKKPDDV